MRHPARWIVGVVAGVTLQACSSKAPPPEQAGEANTVKDVVSQLIETGKVERAFLGIEMQTI